MWKNISLLGTVSLGFLLYVTPVQARENVTDWYIQDFKAQFDVAPDSTMTVTEWITADCGECSGKHGIFRIVPTEARTDQGTLPMSVNLVSITDFQGSSYHFTTIENTSDHTLTWKIGDPNVFVTGVHQYKIVYQVKNVIRFGDQAFDEFYYNVSGNFWTLGIDAYSADIIFPSTVDQKTTTISYYTGLLGSKNSNLAHYDWKNNHTLSVVALRPLKPGEGITLSVSVPKGIFTPYHFGWWERFGMYVWFMMPLVVFWLCFRFWRKYGDDPKWDKVVIPEYEVPENLDALSFGMLSTNGIFKNQFLTAAIVQLAVLGVLTIEEHETKIFFIPFKDFILKKNKAPSATLSLPQERLLHSLFGNQNTVLLSSLKEKFYKKIPGIKSATIDLLAEQGLLEKKSQTYRVTLFTVAGAMFFTSTFFLLFNKTAIIACLMSAVIIFIFGLIMPKRTLKGTEINWRIKGLRLYMNTAEKYRQQFYEKEGIFETLLPYAIVFGMTKEWVKKMQDIYGSEYFQNNHPAWFVPAEIGNFDFESFTTHLESLSSNIASNTGTSSGAGGGGSSGGGGGGGGGGGW